jgi:hypothetical protein
MTTINSIGPYPRVSKRWPKDGRHILATYDDSNIVVYQAYRAAIGEYAAKYQKFGGEYSFSRMSWIKPNFLWMMYRSGWGTKAGQEVILAITVPRTLFDEILEKAVPSSYWSHLFDSPEEWKRALATSEVRLQWDPDHNLYGNKEERKAIQLGLRGSMLRRFAETEVVSIENISEFVRDQRERINVKDAENTMIPDERIYFPDSLMASKTIGLEQT